MDERLYRFLKYTAVVLTLLWLGWTVYDSFFRNVAPGDMAYQAANRLFEDGRYEEALARYNEAAEQASDPIHALRGRARTLVQLNRLSQALHAFDEVIARDPGFGPSYANRGIIYDRLGRYEKAVADYEKALKLDPSLGEGPGWLTRFLRNQAERPPTIADRAQYLREQLAKPESERVLRVPEEDAQQRPYKM